MSRRTRRSINSSPESLETRALLSGVNAFMDGDTLVVRGTAGNDDFSVMPDELGNIVVSCNLTTESTSFPSANVDKVDINAGDGNDNVVFLIEGEVTGGEGDDTLSGAADAVRGGLGDDSIDGSAGDDVPYGNGGNDTINGLDGNDSINGHDGADSIDGGEGRDNLTGDAGPDVVRGGGGNDLLAGEQGDDTIFGGDGDDRILGHEGADSLIGGEGDDRISAN
ncbi:MAG: calcium-binding protein, partial [Planctomycetaceae bacterium]